MPSHHMSLVSALHCLIAKASWETAEPEVIFGFAQTDRATQPKDAYCAATATCSMEAGCAAIRNFRVHLYMIMIRAARLGVWERQWLLEATPPRLDPQFQEIRECLRPVQQVVQTVRQEMAVGRKQRAMGSQALRRIFTLIGTAVALIPGGTSSGSTPFLRRGPRRPPDVLRLRASRRLPGRDAPRTRRSTTAR